MLVVHSITPDQWPQWRELRLAALTDAPEAFCSKLADWQGTGDLEKRWRQRLEGDSLNLIAELDGKPCGMVSGMATDHPHTIELISLWVASFARGLGVADTLIENVIVWAAERGAKRVTLQVLDSNHAAERLYLRHGFVHRDQRKKPSSDRVEREMVLTIKSG